MKGWFEIVGRPALFLISAAALLAGGLALLAPVREAAAQSVDSINTLDGSRLLVDDVNPFDSSAVTSRHELELSLSFVNAAGFTSDDVPLILFEDFTATADGGFRLLTASESAEEGYDYGASAWLAGPSRLVNLGEGEVNELDFTVDVPDEQPSGSYTAAVVFRSSAGDRLGYYLLILNVGRRGEAVTSPALELVRDKSAIDLAAGEIELTVANNSAWHVHALVDLQLELTGDDDERLETVPLTAGEIDLGIFPGEEQTFEPLDGDGLADLSAFGDADATITLKVLDYGLSTELASFDVAALADEAPATGNEDSGEGDGRQAESAAATGGGDGGGQPAAEEADIGNPIVNFFVDNLFIIILLPTLTLALGGIYVLYQRRRRQRSELVIERAPSGEGAPPKTDVVSTPSALGGVPDLPLIKEKPEEENDPFKIG